MGLATQGGAYSAILSAVIFNAIIIPLLIPIALKGVTYRPVGAGALLRRNLLYYGLGGVIAPFIGIKLIDLAIDPLLWRWSAPAELDAAIERSRESPIDPCSEGHAPMIRELITGPAGLRASTFVLCAVAYPAVGLGRWPSCSSPRRRRGA